MRHISTHLDEVKKEQTDRFVALMGFPGLYRKVDDDPQEPSELFHYFRGGGFLSDYELCVEAEEYSDGE